MFTEPKKSSSGLFTVDWKDNFIHWMAWREWYHEQFQKVAFPQKLTVPFAWPPETPRGAQHVADWIKQLRDEVEKEPRAQGGGPCKAVPEIIIPWRGWTDDLKADLAKGEAKRRQEWDNSFSHIPKYPWRVRHGWRMGSPHPNRTVFEIVERQRQAREAAE